MPNHEGATETESVSSSKPFTSKVLNEQQEEHPTSGTCDSLPNSLSRLEPSNSNAPYNHHRTDSVLATNNSRYAPWKDGAPNIILR